jgi:flagellar motility protein MotE (MotC chaperone)
LEKQLRDLEGQLGRISQLEAKVKQMKSLEDEIARLKDQLMQVQQAYDALQITFRNMSR